MNAADQLGVLEFQEHQTFPQVLGVSSTFTLSYYATAQCAWSTFPTDPCAVKNSGTAQQQRQQRQQHNIDNDMIIINNSGISSTSSNRRQDQNKQRKTIKDEEKEQQHIEGEAVFLVSHHSPEKVSARHPLPHPFSGDRGILIEDISQRPQPLKPPRVFMQTAQQRNMKKAKTCVTNVRPPQKWKLNGKRYSIISADDALAHV